MPINRLLGKGAEVAAAAAPIAMASDAPRIPVGKRVEVPASAHGIDPNLVDERAVKVVRTLQQAGFHIKLCSTSANESYRNVIFVASLNQLKELPFELHEPLASTRLVNTDNRPLLEKYNARVNKTWRLNYLRYYQNKK